MDAKDARDPEYDALADVLATLSNANRLRILHQLVSPHTMTELKLPAPGGKGDGDRDYAISRQAVRHHLHQLLDVGLVHMEPGTSHGGARQASYSLDSRRLFAIVEEVRRLGRLRSSVLPEAGPTAVLPATSPATSRQGIARFLVVHGPVEGVQLPLEGEVPRTWTLGRSPDVAVPVEWDPYVSSEHLVVHASEDASFDVENLSTNRNGSTLNFEPLPEGERTPLAHGDVVGVGRTLLVFREH